ncbi:MAG: CDP-glycerol glycerophosphotransferase family protein [Gammaproteobacteria bacterium]|nr:CDP-glycerol--glycerophosphate glycerophosphotransferase [Chromatiales bacterium]MDP6673793.1 CDP-glycerol glycerophosphotransferase family protein [Gammaproteobacteria bacterium]
MKRYLFYVSQNYSFQILRPLQQAICNRGDEVRWFLAGNEVNRDYLCSAEVQLGTIADIIEYQPLAVFAPGNMIPGFIPGLKVALFHGFDVGKMNRRGGEDHFQIRGCFDLYCTQGPSTTARFQELAEQHGYFRVVETGWPAIDPLFDAVDSDSGNRKPTILLCSTFSRNLTCAPHLFDEVARIRNKADWRWLVQFHPKMPADIIIRYKELQNENLTFIETDDVLPLLQQADLMVCDTSSVLVMFLLLQKPVVTYKNISPGPYMHDISEASGLESAIANALKNPPELMQEIRQFANLIHPYRDGLSSERVLQAVEEHLSGSFTLKRKPRNIIRNFKARKKLAYWHL